MFALVLGPEAVARDVIVVVDAPRPLEAQVLPRVAHVPAALLDVLVLGRNQRRNGQQVGRGLARAQHHVPDAPDKRLNDVLDPVKLLLRTET